MSTASEAARAAGSVAKSFGKDVSRVPFRPSVPQPDTCVIRCPMPQLFAGHPLAVEAGCVRLDEKRANTSVPCRPIAGGEHDSDVGYAAVGDPNLLAVQQEAVTVFGPCAL